ncbi:ankyrin repeat domain protein [Nitzschia inconspicua]|uniref:Ankyrin repeat domain protein n=1 Tax=Nitzschia inconspicua TaxID=303405 RepID=A0A9K3LET7_9STRA|nr:ankyrin repeat domain protein [Nitzschia inconspicua]
MRQLFPRTSIVLILSIVLIQHVRSSSHDSVGTTVDLDLNLSTDPTSTQVSSPTTNQQYQEENNRREEEEEEKAHPQYTVLDNASWAITSRNVSSILNPNKQNIYNNFIRDCNLAYYENDESVQLTENTFCQDNDDVRIEMNTHQPSSVYNYTKQGYQKIRTPTKLYSLLRDFWDNHRDKSEPEWSSVTVYQNTWKYNTEMVYVDNERSGGSSKLSKAVYDTVQPLLEDWTGQYLEPVSLWGIRIYKNNSILVPHVDRMPLIVSAIIQVDQDVDEPWPLEVYGHDGKAANVTMEPGDMLLYESHSVIHGRPFPMKGRFYANCFVHFEIKASIDGPSTYDPTLDIPPYIIPHSYWHNEWQVENKEGWRAKTVREDAVPILIGRGDVAGIQKVYHDFPNKLHESDSNGWTALHESVRCGKLSILKTLLGFGMDKDLLTAAGISPLHFARYYHGETHDITQYLVSIGAKDIKHPVGANTNSEL